jgi:signal peptidase I
MREHPFRPGAIILAAALLALAAKSFVIDLAVVDGRSMLPGYRPGDVVVVLRCAFGLRTPFGAPGSRAYLARWAAPAVGDVVAAASPADGAAVVKRVAAIGPVELRVEGAQLRGGGLVLDLAPDEAAVLGSGVTVPAGTVFLLGDNLRESVDSRSYGAVPMGSIGGRVLGAPLFRRRAADAGGDSGIDSNTDTDDAAPAGVRRGLAMRAESSVGEAFL